LARASAADLGRDFGATLTGAEVRLADGAGIRAGAEDVIWRRSKLGLRLVPDQVAALEDYMAAKLAV
jgi:glycerol-3-phosphate dehydrogenase